MAGSYNHVTDENGQLRGESFTDMIENLGDAYEAIEEMYGMIWFLAGTDERAASRVEQARRQYQDGIRMSPSGRSAR